MSLSIAISSSQKLNEVVVTHLQAVHVCVSTIYDTIESFSNKRTISLLLVKMPNLGKDLFSYDYVRCLRYGPVLLDINVCQLACRQF